MAAYTEVTASLKTPMLRRDRGSLFGVSFFPSAIESVIRPPEDLVDSPSFPDYLVYLTVS